MKKINLKLLIRAALKGSVILSVILASFLSQQIEAADCRLKLEKIGESTRQSRDLKIGKHSSFKDFSGQSSNKETSFLSVTSGKTVTMIVDDFEVEILCRRLSRSAEVEIKIKSSTAGLVTSREISPGQMIDLGKVVQDLSSKDQTLKIPVEISKNRSSGKKRQEYYLLLLD
jgi:hypothetical protein